MTYNQKIESRFSFQIKYRNIKYKFHKNMIFSINYNLLCFTMKLMDIRRMIQTT